jgi:hypothetical protein
VTVRWPQSNRKRDEGAESPPARSRATRDRRSDRRREVELLGLVLLGIAVFFTGYATGRHDSTFRTSWFSPLRGTSAAPEAVGSVQGGPNTPGENTPLMVTVRGLRILPSGEHYVLYVLSHDHGLLPCGTFAVGNGTTQVKLSYPGLRLEPRGWRIARERFGATDPGKIVARTV